MSLEENHTVDYDLPYAWVERLWSDSILRYSKILDGLFHDKVVVCESDSDCMFYNALLDAVSPAHRPDIHLVHGATKSRIATIISSLRALNVPVTAIADFDVLQNEDDIKKIVTAFGGEWSDYKQRWQNIHQAITQKRSELSKEEAEKDINGIFSKIKTDKLSEKDIKEIKDILNKTSPWKEAKSQGTAFLPSGDASKNCSGFLKDLAKIGLHIVPYGETESFCKHIGGHGPKFVSDVISTYDLSNAEELEDARKFIRSVIQV